MSARPVFDSPFGDGVGSDDTVPGAMHELVSDGEEDEADSTGADEFEIEPDDLDDSNAPAKRLEPGPAPQSGLQTLPSYQTLMSSLATKGGTTATDSAAAAAGDEDENHGFIEDDASTGGAEDDDEDDTVDDSTIGAPPSGSRVHSFESMFERAKKLETRGFLRKAAHYYLYCLEHYRFSHQHQELIALCLRRLGDICYKNKKYKEALQFRTAERMVYESNLLRIVKTDAAAEARAAAEESKEEKEASASSSSSASSTTSASSLSSRPNMRIMQMRSADPTPIVRTPITPKSLLHEEERALTYERLAKVFFEEKNIDMAKSYAIKAIEIRRRIKAKWGDPSQMDTDQLLLHQLAVMGQEQYKQTLKQFRGDGTADAEADEVGESGETKESEEAARRFSMAQSLQALSSGKFNAKPTEAASSASATAASSSSSSAAADDDATAVPADADRSALRQRTASGKTAKKVEFAGDDASGACGASGASSVDAADDSPALSSVVVTRTSRPLNRRALLVSLFVALLFILLSGYLITHTFESTFFDVHEAGRAAAAPAAAPSTGRTTGRASLK